MTATTSRAVRRRVRHVHTAPAVLPTGALAEPLGEYLANDGFSFMGNGSDVIDVAAAVDLRGRGGAGFPLARKLAAVAAQPDPVRVVVANGEEGEPGSVKDRTLLRLRPHLVLDGVQLAARAVGAHIAYVYVSDDVSADVIRGALRERATSVPIEVVTVPHTYVAGEESAVVRAIDGGPAMPTAKPPRAYEVGVGAHPTAVSNVETLAQLALAANHGIAAYGRGSLLVTLAGADAEPALHEVGLGTPLRTVVETHLGRSELGDVTDVLMGGLFGGLAGPEALDLPLDTEAMRAAGTSLGCGSFYLLTDRDCAVDVVADAMAYLGRESSRQCGSCLKGTAAMADAFAAIAGGRGTQDHLDGLGRWSITLVGRGNCALLDAACSLTASLIARHADTLSAHLHSACPTCTARDEHADTRLRLQP